jgi:hypothetical protein
VENRDQGAEIAAALGGIFYVFDTVMSVRMNDFLPERFEGAARRNDLVQNFSAVRVLGHQSFKRLDLAANLSQPYDERVFFAFRVNMSHDVTYATVGGIAKEKRPIDE